MKQETLTEYSEAVVVDRIIVVENLIAVINWNGTNALERVLEDLLQAAYWYTSGFAEYRHIHSADRPLSDSGPSTNPCFPTKKARS